MGNRNTIEFLGIWESLYNFNFKPFDFEGFKKSAGLNAFNLSPNLCKRLTPIHCKDINKELRVLVKQGLVLPYKTKHGIDVSLNPRKIRIIKNIIAESIYDINKL